MGGSGGGATGGAPMMGEGGDSAAGGMLNAAGGSGAAPPVASRPARVLLYSFSTLNIPSVPAQLTILSQHLADLGYEADESEDPGAFTDDNLAQYAAVGMINTCFSPFGENSSGETEAQALQRFLQDGGGLFGTHCADVTFQGANPPALYNELIGGRASSSNFEGNNQCTKVEEHPTTAGLPDTFAYNGNLDGTDFIADDSTILVRCTWGDANSTEVAISWVRTEGDGRVFFTNFGKVDADLTNATVGDAHILAGLDWVLGL
jgi:cytochrome c